MNTPNTCTSSARSLEPKVPADIADVLFAKSSGRSRHLSATSSGEKPCGAKEGLRVGTRKEHWVRTEEHARARKSARES